LSVSASHKAIKGARPSQFTSRLRNPQPDSVTYIQHGPHLPTIPRRRADLRMFKVQDTSRNDTFHDISGGCEKGYHRAVRYRLMLIAPGIQRTARKSLSVRRGVRFHDWLDCSDNAYLCLSRVNVIEGEPNDRPMTTGNHTVRDIYCCKCNTTLGWKYVCSPEFSPRVTLLDRSRLGLCVRSHTEIQRRQIHTGTQPAGGRAMMTMTMHICIIWSCLYLVHVELGMQPQRNTTPTMIVSYI
jgi:hypothetical protein